MGSWRRAHSCRVSPWGGAVAQHVIWTSDGHRIGGGGDDAGLASQFLAHLGSRAFSPATVRAYAYDLLNFLRFLAGRRARLADVVPTDLFDYLDWQQRPAGTAGRRVVRLAEWRGAAPSTMNRRVAAVRGLFEFAVMTGVRTVNPVPAPAGPAVCARARGACWGTSGLAGRGAAGGWCASHAGCPSPSSPATWCSSRTCGPSGTGRSCWRCCWADCGPPRCGRCGWPPWTWGCAGSG